MKDFWTEITGYIQFIELDLVINSKLSINLKHINMIYT